MKLKVWAHDKFIRDRYQHYNTSKSQMEQNQNRLTGGLCARCWVVYHLLAWNPLNSVNKVKVNNKVLRFWLIDVVLSISVLNSMFSDSFVMCHFLQMRLKVHYFIQLYKTRSPYVCWEGLNIHKQVCLLNTNRVNRPTHGGNIYSRIVLITCWIFFCHSKWCKMNN